MLNLVYVYDQNSARLQVEGLPDFSRAQTNEMVGIVSSWKLQIAGFPQLEGKKEHLRTLLDVIYPYIRYYLSGTKRSFGDSCSSVNISPYDKGHQIILRSSKKDIKPLKIILDDAELVDLVTCLDKFIKDPRVSLNWPYPSINYSPVKLNLDNDFRLTNFVPSILGAFSIILFSAMFVLIPNENNFVNNILNLHNKTAVESNETNP